MVDKEKAAEDLRKIANDWANCVWDEEGVLDEDKTPESTLCLARSASALGYLAGHDHGEAKADLYWARIWLISRGLLESPLCRFWTRGTKNDNLN